MRRIAGCAGAGLLALAASVAATPGMPRPGADLILENGRIVTVDPEFRIVEAVAVRDGRFVAVGSAAAIDPWRGPGTEVIDLEGKTVIPGLIDGHNHLMLGGLDMRGVDLSRVRGMEELLREIADRIAATPQGDLVVSSSAWHESQLSQGRLPTKADLDPISPDHPVVLLRGALQVVMNSRALARAGINAETPDPDGGRIARDPETREPIGEITSFGRRAVTLEPVRTVLPAPSPEAKLAAIKRGMEYMNRLGVTSIREPALEPDDMKLFQRLRSDGALTIRVSMLLFPNMNLPVEEIRRSIEAWGVVSGFGDEMLRLDGIKLVMDGGFESALMTAPYVGREDYRGIQAVSGEKLEAILSTLNDAGWRTSVHCVGDRAIDLVLDAFATSHRRNSIDGRRWTLEHGMLVSPRHYDLLKELGVFISTQHHTFVAGRSMANMWGESRAAATMPLRELLDAGIPVGGGTDWPVAPGNPFSAMYFWVSRDTRFGGVVGAEHAITREEALRLHTSAAAALTGEEAVKGSIEIGKLADLVILNEDYLTVAEDAIEMITPIATMVGGEWVYRRQN
jgi:predicted amidohydrolase YtcJ